MAIFESPSQTKAIIDDTEKLICVVENAQNINKHTEYILRVQRGPNKENKWNVSRRYRDFAELHASIHQAAIDLPLPPKKLFGNMQPSFIAERQIALQTYINEVLKHDILAMSLQVRSFLDPKNYTLAIAEQALQTMSIALRGDGRYELKAPLTDIGWRIRKHYFLVTDIESRSNCVLSWQNYGPDRYLSDKELQTAFKSLLHLSHPFIDPILAIHNLETGAYVVRRIHESGSLRDILYGTDYNKSHLAKYGNPKLRRPFTHGQISHYGHQILMALKFLHDKGIPHGHIHPGNISIENQKVLLMDLENSLMGVPCLHRPKLVECRASSAEAVDVYCFGLLLYEMTFAETVDTHYKDHFPNGIPGDLGLTYFRNLGHSLVIVFHRSKLVECRASSAEAVDVYCFGLLLYEMTFAETVDSHYRDHFPNGIPGDLESVLRLCLSRSSWKQGGPSLCDLLSHPLFSRVPALGVYDDRAHLKFPLALKDELKAAANAAELRLKGEQKLVRNAKREVRIQEILGSEEELKRQKRRAKKRDSLWKSTSSLADTVRSRSGSTASSPTPPVNSGDASGSSSATPAGASPATPLPHTAVNGSTVNGRGALLNAICSFDRTRLARVESR